jgi:hypothetical protein
MLGKGGETVYGRVVVGNAHREKREKRKGIKHGHGRASPGRHARARRS